MYWLMNLWHWYVIVPVLLLLVGAVYFYMEVRKKALGPQKPTQRGVIR